ncbi:MAG TPA: 16S rRNA (cytosine(1402)-N(4))-methyltransferase RsmH [Verrucomicrobiae bacterium]|nr:16S rRNA (cytosine(1402)-N(4))-methyltransferase RsmH [Verrucomicrobiae bacterium]
MFTHVSVLLEEAIGFLSPAPGRRYLDGTLGGGGHAEQILLGSSPDGEVLGLDRDDEALAAAEQRLRSFAPRLLTRQASFATAQQILNEIHWESVDGVILDLGISSHQVNDAERGFSFRSKARLDMRMDRRQSLDARQIINTFGAAELEKIFRDFGEEPQARRLAQAIVAERKARSLETTDALAALVERIKGHGWRDHHPATQIFQALRIAVNEEIRQLELFLASGYELLRPGGRMTIIAFQSLEDRLVKNAFRKWSRACICPPRAMSCQCGWSQKVRLLTKKPVVPSANEIGVNPRARSAKLRAVERV